ncbi:hypothetical protein OROHE_002413 [Orobanche hederae]
MERYVRKREGSGETTEMVSAAGRKRKTVLQELEISTSSVQLKTCLSAAETPGKPVSPACSGNFSCESVSSAGNVLASCCSSSRSNDELAEESPRLENAVDVEYYATSAGPSVDFRDSIYPSQRREVKTSSCFLRREETPPSEVQITEPSELELMAPSPHESNFSRFPKAEKIPTEAELEEFFAAAEKNLQKQFVDKYNYDIAKDEPLEGRYEWVPVQLKP